MTTKDILNNYFFPKMFQIQQTLNHPFKILINYLRYYTSPYNCEREGINLYDLYFSALDIYLSKLNKKKEPLSHHELNKRKVIKEQKNIYLQIALMDPKIYDNDDFFNYHMGLLYDYNGDFKNHRFLMFTDEEEDESFKRTYKVLINMIKNIDNLIEKSY